MMYGIMATGEGFDITTAVTNGLNLAGTVFDFVLQHPVLSLFVVGSLIGVATGIINSLK